MDNFTSISLVAVTEVIRSKEETVGLHPGLSSSSKDPLPYDPMLGWYTAATLSGLLLLFLACVGLEKVKDKLLLTFDKDHRPIQFAGATDPCLGGRMDQDGRGRCHPDDPKSSAAEAESAALLGSTPAASRNCIDHNYVYLTLDRPNHADVVERPHSVVQPIATTSPLRTGFLGAMGVHREGASSLDCGEGQVEARTTPTTAEGGGGGGGGQLTTHSVKIEIAEVHSESPVHEMMMTTIEERDVGGDTIV